jgi:hypothetical protein
VCCVSFDRGVILCDVCYLFVVSYCKPLPLDKNPFAVNKYYIIVTEQGVVDSLLRMALQVGVWGEGANISPYKTRVFRNGALEGVQTSKFLLKRKDQYRDICMIRKVKLSLGLIN